MKKFIVTSNYTQGSQVLVQGGHAVDELSLECFKGKYAGTNLESVYVDWNENHKTYVSLEVGRPSDIVSMHEWLLENEKELNVPSAIFKEPEMNDTVTALSFVATEKLSMNFQFTVKNFLSHLKREKGIRLFEELNDSIEYLDTNGDVDVLVKYDKKTKLTTLICEDLEQTYNKKELEFFLKFRFLPLKK